MKRQNAKGWAARSFFIMMGLGPVLLVLGGSGCSYYHYPVNAQLTQWNPETGYRVGYRGKDQLNPLKKDLVLLATFSGGGTRAAAFSYGVLEALRDTKINLKGENTTLLQQLDSISAVSGGSFTAAYYGLFGDRIFQDFEARFLKKNVQGDLTINVLFNPFNWVRLFSPYFDRSDLAAEYYDKNLFEGATFGDFLKQQGPMIFINATDMIQGTRISFTQDAFDVLCSDISTFSVARACAASSAVPLLLSPVTLKNYAGSCGYHMPALLEAAMKERDLPDRRFDLANNVLPFLDSKSKPYIHLVDGGVADNLGIRALLEKIISTGDAWTTLKATGQEEVHKIVFLIVNSETEIDPKWNLLSSTPPFSAMVDSYSSIAIARYNVETVALLRESLRGWEEQIRQGRCSSGQISLEPGSCGDIKFYMIEIKFDALKGLEERTYFKRLPTSFALPAEVVDKLREAAGQILRNSREFKRLLNDLEGQS
jgi:NTE family protein